MGFVVAFSMVRALRTIPSIMEQGWMRVRLSL